MTRSMAKGKKRTFQSVHLGGWGREGEIKLESKSSEPEQVSEAPGKGCGIQMWRGGGEQGRGAGEACSQLALILCDDVEIVGKHESRVVRTCLSEQPRD